MNRLLTAMKIILALGLLAAFLSSRLATARSDIRPVSCSGSECSGTCKPSEIRGVEPADANCCALVGDTCMCVGVTGQCQ
jgi:hypothetical protein